MHCDDNTHPRCCAAYRAQQRDFDLAERLAALSPLARARAQYLAAVARGEDEVAEAFRQVCRERRGEP